MGERSDDAQMVVMESVLLGLVVIGAVGYVVTFQSPTPTAATARTDLTTAGADALVVMHGLQACADFATADVPTCEAAYGRTGLKRFVTEAVAGNATNLTLRMRTLLPDGAAWNLYLDTGAGTHVVARTGEPAGETVTAMLPLAPEWNGTWVLPRFSTMAPALLGENDLLVRGLPMLTSRAVAPDAGAAFPVTFPNAYSLDLDRAVVDAERGSRFTLAAWHFDENSGTVAAEAQGRYPLTVDEARWTPGRTGSALDFAGAGTGLTVGHADMEADAVTLSVWVRPDGTPTEDARVLEYARGGTSLVLGIAGATGEPFARVTSDAGTVTATAPDALTLAAWTHLAATFDGARVTVHVGGAEAAAADATAAWAAGTPTLTLAHLAGEAGGAFDGRMDRVRAYSRALAEADHSIMRYALAPEARGADPGWDATTGPVRVVKSALVMDGTTHTGRGTYRVVTDAEFAALLPALQRGVNESVLAAYDNATGKRHVPVGHEVAIEADFDPLVDALANAGVTLASPAKTTVTVHAPVTQPVHERGLPAEVANLTVGDSDGYLNRTVDAGWLLGTHVVVATVDLQVVTSNGVVGVLAREMDYFHVVHPGGTDPPVNPVYRAVLELWVPDWW